MKPTYHDGLLVQCIQQQFRLFRQIRVCANHLNNALYIDARLNQDTREKK